MKLTWKDVKAFFSTVYCRNKEKVRYSANSLGSLLGILMTALVFVILNEISNYELTPLQLIAIIIIIGGFSDFVHRMIYTWIGYLTPEDKQTLDIDKINKEDVTEAQDTPNPNI